MARKKQSKLGRPPKHEGELLSKNRTFRVRGTLDEQLEAAAQKAGRSVSEEIERRLDDSFKRTEELYGGARTSAMFRVIADAIALLKAGGSLAETDRARASVARFFADLLVEVPGFHSVTIETVNEQGQVRGVISYPSEEIEKRDYPDRWERRHARLLEGAKERAK